MNKVTIIGNLTRDPEMRSTKDGTPVCSFTVAVNRRVQEGADFFRVNAWRGLAENCKRYLAKGRKVAVVGSVRVNTYTAQDGSTRASMEVTAEDVEFLSAAGTAVHEAAGAQADARAGFVKVDSEELPF